MESKLPHVGTTIFTVMSQLANDCDAINLSQGFPSFEPDSYLRDRVSHYLNNGCNQYAPMSGVPSLRAAIAAKVSRVYGRHVSVDDEVTVTPGATEALFCAIMATVRGGDEVIVLDPAYDSYDPATTLAGGRTVHVPMRVSAEGEFSPDWQAIADAINDKTRLIILNFPHNPSGAILSADDLDTLADLIRNRPIYLLSDEVYEHIVFDGHDHQSLLRHDELWSRTFVVSSFGKTVHATGWKIGYCLAPAELSTEFRKVHQFNCFAVVTPMQLALADFMDNKPEHYQDLSEFYEKLRDYFASLLDGSKWRLKPSRSTFFQVADYADISDEKDTEFAIRLTREIGVAAIPVSVFSAQPTSRKLLRFCFAKDQKTLEKAAEKLCSL